MPCSNCGAPIASSAIACVFCSQLLHPPASPEEEIRAVREQALVLNRLASAGNTGPDAMRFCWQSAYIPTTVEALRLGLLSAVAALPEVEDDAQAKALKVLVGAIHSRAAALADALCFHPDALEVTRQEAARHRRTIHDRGESLRVALRRENAFLAVCGCFLFGCFFAPVVGLLSNVALGALVFAAAFGFGFYARHVMLTKRPYVGP